MGRRSSMPHARLSADEIVERGKQIYEERLRALVEPGNEGRLLVIDVETGDYELADDLLSAGDRLHARHPGAALYSMRIGSPVLYRIGAGRPSTRSSKAA
jgi:hypothetical protein